MFVDVWEGAGAAEEVAGYCQMWGLEGTVLLDEAADCARAFGVRGVPTNVFVDETGMVRSVGATTAEQLLREATRLEPRLAGLAPATLAADRVPGAFAADA